MNRYLIPRRITQRWELFPGWGWAELAATGIGLLVGAILFALASLLGLPVAVRIFMAILAVGGGAGLARPMPTGDSALVMLQRGRRFYRSPRHYLYDFGRDDA